MKGRNISKLKKLIDLFEYNIKQYKGKHYDEAKARSDFIDKFFILLDWDVHNDQGFAEQYRDVVREDRLEIKGKVKAPDYCFRIGGSRKFFVEAKKPAINIKHDIEPAFQLRRYAYTAKLPLSILTDFEEFAVYDTRIKPDKHDRASIARIFYCTYQEYKNEYDFIFNTFSRGAILKGSFDQYIEDTKRKRGTSEVDKEFLKLIEKWRENLAKNIALRNKKLSIYELNYAVQKIIDRIIFLRIAEDRHIENYGRIQKLNESKKTIYPELIKLFLQADVKYDSGLFDFQADQITPSLKIDDRILKDIFKSLYYPDSPYEFSVFDVEILGNIYEQFLGKTIRLTPSHQAKVEDKPEVKKAGGVYYTPKYIVDYIVKNTVGEKIKNKIPDQISKLKICDPACGSGSFLLGAYQTLMNYHLDYYTKEKNLKKALKENKIYQLKENEYRLTIEEKHGILLNNIFGVDIDSQAVEVTKLSLLLKLMEGESQESTGLLFKFSDIKLLPDLSDNIKCGNSLIGSDFYETSQMNLFQDEETTRRINVFDWPQEFPDIFNNNGFDIIIGNPPYLKETNNKELFENLRLSKIDKYCQGKMDLWYAFACKSIDLLNNNGLHGFIATNNWITNDGASILREKILSETKIKIFIDFADFKVFQKASIQTMIYILKKGKVKNNYFAKYIKIKKSKLSITELISILNFNDDELKKYQNLSYSHFYAYIDSKKVKDRKIKFINRKIYKVLEKIHRNSNFQLKNEELGNGIDVLQDFVSIKHLEILKKKEIKKGDGIFVLNDKEIKSLKLSNNEFELLKPYYTSLHLKRYWGDRNTSLRIIYSDINVRKNINKYPNIKNHLNKFRDIITSDFGPYGLHRARNEFFFSGKKILSLRKTKIACFIYTDFPTYVSRAFLIIKTERLNMKYLISLLNSKLINFWLYYEGKKQGDQLQIDLEPLKNLPLFDPTSSNSNQKDSYNTLINYIRQMLSLQNTYFKSKTSDQKSFNKKQIDILDNQINKLVYDLYGLNEEEIKIVEESIGEK